MTVLTYLLIAANAAVWFGALWRISRLTRAVRHHEHVLRLTLTSLSTSCPHPLNAHSFGLLVLNEKPWDQRDAQCMSDGSKGEQ